MLKPVSGPQAFPSFLSWSNSTDKEAIDKLQPGDAVIIFTPDSKSLIVTIINLFFAHAVQIDTHYNIAIYAIERGIHVLVTKPATQLLSHHNELIAAAEKHKVVCFVEHHKRLAYSSSIF